MLRTKKHPLHTQRKQSMPTTLTLALITDIAVKKEAPDVEFVWDRFIPTEAIELSDTEDVEPKIEDDVYEFT